MIHAHEVHGPIVWKNDSTVLFSLWRIIRYVSYHLLRNGMDFVCELRPDSNQTLRLSRHENSNLFVFWYLHFIEELFVFTISSFSEFCDLRQTEILKLVHICLKFLFAEIRIIRIRIQESKNESRRTSMHCLLRLDFSVKIFFDALSRKGSALGPIRALRLIDLSHWWGWCHQDVMGWERLERNMIKTKRPDWLEAFFSRSCR